MAISHYQELIAWQRTMDLVVGVYRLTESFPSSELHGLSNQLRRAAVSIPSNIAEGRGRAGATEFCHYLRIANGSRQEVETQIIVASRLGYLKEESYVQCMTLADETGRLINGLLRAIKKRS